MKHDQLNIVATERFAARSLQAAHDSGVVNPLVVRDIGQRLFVLS